MERIYRIIFAAVLMLTAAACYRELPFPDDEEEQAVETLPAWQKGYLDIHHISTGRGDCTFMILPDGTTMMVDAGDLGSRTYTQEIMNRIPFSSRTPGEWIVRYVSNYLTEAGLDSKHLDYLMVTHYHNDHIGTPSDYSIPSTNGKYQMTGVSYVGNFLNIDEIVDRDYPDFSYPTTAALQTNEVENYKEYLKDRVEKDGKVTKFKVGTDSQFVLKHAPADFPTFSIRNIYSSGTIWTGEEDKTKSVVPAGTDLSQHANENLWSSVINLQYGDFDYHCGGDILGGYSDWRNVESAVGSLIGETDVYNCDHHAYSDAMNSDVISLTTPQVFVIPVWDYFHPEPEPLVRMLDKELYPSDRLVFAAGMVESNRIRLLEDGQKIQPDGHIVVRVYEGGSTFQVFVVNDRTTTFDVVHKSEKLTSNK